MGQQAMRGAANRHGFKVVSRPKWAQRREKATRTTLTLHESDVTRKGLVVNTITVVENYQRSVAFVFSTSPESS